MSKLNMSTKRKATWIAPSFDDFPKVKTTTRQTRKKIEVDIVNKDKIEHENDDIPWVDKYKPQVEEDLAIHKKKIQEVKSWLENYSDHQTSRTLLLTGPSGSGKSAVLHTLTAKLGLDLKEWINPSMQEYRKDLNQDATSRQESQSQLFHDFLLRANRYNQLDVISNEKPDSDFCRSERKIILVEDIPNFLLYDSTKMHTILRRYKANGKCPLVFIMSDSNSDNFINALFPKKLQTELDITNISFNPIAQTGLTKTMLKIATSESKQRSEINIPNKDVLDLLASSSNGDIRSCINSLQFYCTDSLSLNYTGSSKKKSRTTTTTSKNSKKNNKKSNSTKDLDKIAGCIGEKDTSLFLFRALGKILYCKREGEFDEVENELPSHLKDKMRKRLIETPEDVFENTQVSAGNYLLYLHQNYPEFFTKIDDVEEAISHCCHGDVISSNWENKHLENYTASLSARGLMFANTRPSSTSGGGGGGWRPLHKPQWFEVFKSSNRNLKTVRDSFKGCHYSREALFTDVIPYIDKLRSNVGSTIKEISHFTLTRNQQSRRLLHTLSNDRIVLEDDENSMDSYLTMATNNSSSKMAADGGFTFQLENGGQTMEDDDVIEDFDD